MYRVLSFLTLFLTTACSPPEVFSGNESDQSEWSEGVLSPAEDKKVLLIFIDGLIPSAIELSETPNIDALMVDSAWSMTGRAESTTISGSGWSSFLTGVHWDKHQVPDNDFTNPNFTNYPHIFSQLKAGLPNSVVAGCQTWQPIESGMVLPAEPDFSAFHDYYDYSDDYWDEASADSLCTQEVVNFANESNINLLVMMFAELDGVGHQSGFGAEYETYQAMLQKTDTEIGLITDAIKARPHYGDEDWLIILSTDHSGEPELHHGANIPEHRLIPFIMNGPSVVAGEIWPPPQTVDIVATALTHLGTYPVEGSDGVPVGFESTSPPTARLGENLIFNGDAEYERGYFGYESVPDASLPGWYDPGFFTVVQYDSPGGYPGDMDPGPSDRGENFFAGGWITADSYATWEVDVSNIASDIDGGANWNLSAWLGGYLDQEDSSAVTVHFLDESGVTLNSDSIGPVTASDRSYLTGLLERTKTGPVPAGTRKVQVRVDAFRATGYNDGYADNLSLVITTE